MSLISSVPSRKFRKKERKEKIIKSKGKILAVHKYKSHWMTLIPQLPPKENPSYIT